LDVDGTDPCLPMIPNPRKSEEEEEEEEEVNPLKS
jgi:hypothetical protein